MILSPENLQSSISDVFFSLSHHKEVRLIASSCESSSRCQLLGHYALLSFPSHLGVSKVAQAPDLPWGILATISP